MNLNEIDEMILRDISKNTDGNNTKKGLKEFQKSLKVYTNQQLNNYVGKIDENDILKRSYFNYFMSALLLEHERKFKNTDIHIKARIKSENSFKTKLIHRTFKKEFEKNINDIFGIRIVIDDTKNMLPKESILSKERDASIKELTKLTEFRDEFLIDVDKSKLSREAYFQNLLQLLIEIQKILPEKSTNLIESYKQKEKIVRQKIDYLSINPNKKIQNEDLHVFNSNNEVSDFENLLSDFEARVDDKVFYQILKNQIRTLLKTSSLMSKLGIKIVSEKSKEKENGYVAKFIKLITPAGEIEIQLQTKHQYEQGAITHMDYKYNDPPAPIPNNLENKEQINDYRNKTNPMLPEMFSASIDELSIEPAVLIRKESDYASLKEAYQVSPHSHLKRDIDEYLARVYKNKNKLFENSDSSTESIQMADIIEYIDSEEFKKLKGENEKSIEDEEER